MRFDFGVTEAIGTVTVTPASPDSTRRVENVRQNLAGSIFDSNIIEMVVAALPLSPRFSAELPFFIYERGGRVPVQVVVEDRAMEQFPLLGTRDAWVVSVDVPGAPATVWLDASTRATLTRQHVGRGLTEPALSRIENGPPFRRPVSFT